MNEDRLTGNAKNFGGQVEEGFGRATGDVKSQLQGKAKQMEGAVQDVYGQVKETASDAVQSTPSIDKGDRKLRSDLSANARSSRRG